MSHAAKPNLLGLPGELRIRIYELVVFHEESGGVISPIKDEGTALRRPIPRSSHDHGLIIDLHQIAASSMTLVSDDRFKIYENRPQLPDPEEMEFGPLVMRAWNLVAMIREQERFHKVWNCSANALSGHLCTLDCLLQPAVTRLNRDIRKDALPIFYTVNKFHLEMENFVVATLHGWRKGVRSPIDWWRAIGDINLQNIHRLDIVGRYAWIREIWGMDLTVAYTESSVIVRYREATGKVQMSQLEQEYSASAYPEGEISTNELLLERTEATGLQASYDRKLERREGELEGVLQPHLDVLSDDGLTVKVLECIVAALEPIDRHYLRDEYALQGLKRTSAINEQQSEITTKQALSPRV